VNDWPEEGICSTCAVEGKRVYYVSNRCTLVCADTEGFLDGKNDGIESEKYRDKTDADIIWELDMMEELDVFPHNLATSSPLIVGDLVYILTSNGVDEGHLVVPSPRAPSFIAVNKHTGKVVWTDDSPGDRIFHGQWSSPTYGVVNGKGQVYMPGGDGWLYAFEPLGDPDNPGQGKIIWKFDCNPLGAKYVLGGRGTANEIISTTVFKNNRVYIAVGQDPEHLGGIGHLYAIDATKTGDVSEHLGIWDPVERVKKPMVDSSGKPILGADGKPARNPNSAMIWHYGNRDFGRTISTCAVTDELVVAAELDGFLHCLDIHTGKLFWKHDLLAQTWGSPYIVDGKIYIGDEDGDVDIFEASQTKNQLGHVEMGTTVPSTAVAVDGVLYLATKTHVYALKQQ
jgi:outer membrane protein assembly factor BamB